MNITEISTYLEDNKDSEEVKTLVGSLQKPLSKETVEEYLSTEEGKKLIQPTLDSYFTTGLNTWKEKTLPKVVEEEISKRYPAETEDQKRIRALEETIRQTEREKNLAQIRSKALSTLSEKKLPQGVVDFFTSDTEENLDADITKFEEIFNQAVQAAVEERLRSAGRTPFESSSSTDSANIDSMSMKEYEAYRRKQGIKR